MDTTMNRDGAPSLMEFSAEPAWNSCEGRKLPMIQRVEEQGGRILLYLDPPARASGCSGTRRGRGSPARANIVCPVA